MNKPLFLLKMLCACLSLAASPAFADTLVKTGNAEALIVQRLSFVKDDDLNFGRIFPSTTAGTVVLAPDGTRTADNGIILAGSTHLPARFAGRGRRNQFVTVSLSTSSILINGPGASMTVRDFVIGSNPTVVLGTAPLRFRIASTSGIFAFPVGATLDVGANQAAGKYTGNWNITLDYQ
jgi:hypothetical protein